MNIILVVAICMLITGNIVLMAGVKSLTKDLKDYQAIIKSTMENNDKLIKINTDMQKKYDKLNKEVDEVLLTATKQNELTEMILRDNAELTALTRGTLQRLDHMEDDLS